MPGINGVANIRETFSRSGGNHEAKNKGERRDMLERVLQTGWQ